MLMRCPASSFVILRIPLRRASTAAFDASLFRSDPGSPYSRSSQLALPLPNITDGAVCCAVRSFGLVADERGRRMLVEGLIALAALVGQTMVAAAATTDAWEGRWLWTHNGLRP